MNAAIFHVQGDGKLTEMRETHYDSEAMLQTLLADYPNLLAGDQMDSGDPRRWLLVAQEIGIPGEENATDRWALDHLFLDQEGIPTLVEVKRRSDTRIRREVVGQMLDYAANAVAYWPAERVQMKFEETCKRSGIDPNDALIQLLGATEKVAGFWTQVATNLNAGRVRLVFVADEIPAELRRIVEFLNGQMNPAEVLAVEIKQFAGEGGKVFVPRVLGITAEADAKKQKPTGKTWDETSYFAALAVSQPNSVATARAILRWANEQPGLLVVWGKGQTPTYSITLVQGGRRYNPVSIDTEGQVCINFSLIKSPPFDEDASREVFRTRLNRVPEVAIPADKIGGYPTFPLSKLADLAAREVFFGALDWFFTRVKAEPSSE